MCVETLPAPSVRTIAWGLRHTCKRFAWRSSPNRGRGRSCVDLLAATESENRLKKPQWGTNTVMSMRNICSASLNGIGAGYTAKEHTDHSILACLLSKCAHTYTRAAAWTTAQPEPPIKWMNELEWGSLPAKRRSQSNHRPDEPAFIWYNWWAQCVRVCWRAAAVPPYGVYRVSVHRHWLYRHMYEFRRVWVNRFHPIFMKNLMAAEAHREEYFMEVCCSFSPI